MKNSGAISSSWGRSASSSSRTIRARLIVDGDHYDSLVAPAESAIANAKVSVWIATANLKTMLVEAPLGTRARASGRFVSFFEVLGELAQRGVEVRVLHASEPSRPLAAQLGAGSTSKEKDKEKGGVLRRQCPRVHLKMIAVDGRRLYLGSANLTGAGLGAKGDGRRNFEMGLVTDDDAMLDVAQERFDRIWRGAECASCKLRRECPKPLDVQSPVRTSRGGSRRARRSPSSPR